MPLICLQYPDPDCSRLVRVTDEELTQLKKGATDEELHVEYLNDPTVQTLIDDIETRESVPPSPLFAVIFP